MKELPADFDLHARVQILQNEDPCYICSEWDEPAWYWHDDVYPPGSLAEDLARLREALRLAGLAGLEMLLVTIRAIDRAQRRLRGLPR